MKKTFLVASATVAGLALASQPRAFAEEQPPAPLNSRAAVAPLTTSGFITKTYSVIVNVNGTLALGPSGTTSDDFGSPTGGEFEVIFPSPVNACAFVATIGDDLGDVPAAGLVNVTQRATTHNGVFVQTFNPNGVRTNHPFHLIVQC